MEKQFDQKHVNFLDSVIPKYEKVHPSLISVLRAHSETNLSNLLAYFFKGEFNKNLQQVFINSLISCIYNEGNEYAFLDNIFESDLTDIEVHTEYRTKSGRIDILILFRGNYGSEKSAIIIENKLYHDINNDFDDYFYSVSNQEDILPKKIVLVVLGLKDSDIILPVGMNTAKVIHNTLLKTILTEISEDVHLLYENMSKLLFGEYIKHINDLYFQDKTFSNNTFFEYYSFNRILVNEVVLKGNLLFKLRYEDINLEDRKIIHKYRSKIEDIISSHSSTLDYATYSFNKYVELTERGAKGPGNFLRGKGLSYHLIRYKFDFENHFIDNSDIDFEVFLNGRYLKDFNIDLTSSKYKKAVGIRGLSNKSYKINNTGWFSISSKKLEIDETLFNNIFKENIESDWDEVEKILIKDIGVFQRNQFYDIVDEFLKSKGCIVYHNTNNSVKDIESSWPTTFTLFRYKIIFTPSDLVEVVLYIADSMWDEVCMNFKEKTDFVVFSERQSILFSDISDDQGNHFYALFKKSFRVDMFNNNEQIIEKISENRDLWVNLENAVKKYVIK